MRRRRRLEVERKRVEGMSEAEEEWYDAVGG